MVKTLPSGKFTVPDGLAYRAAVGLMPSHLGVRTELATKVGTATSMAAHHHTRDKNCDPSCKWATHLTHCLSVASGMGVATQQARTKVQSVPQGNSFFVSIERFSCWHVLPTGFLSHLIPINSSPVTTERSEQEADGKGTGTCCGRDRTGVGTCQRVLLGLYYLRKETS